MSVLFSSASSQYINLGTGLSVVNGIGTLWMEATIRCTGGGLQIIVGFSVGGTPPQANPRAVMAVQAGTFRVYARAPDAGTNQSVNSGITVNDGNWHNVSAFISYATDTIFYAVDGSVGSGAVSFGAASTTGSNAANGTIGALMDGSNYYFNGDILDVRVSPDTQISAEATETVAVCRGLDGIRAGVAHRYMLDELAPGVVVPASGSPVKDLGTLRRDGNGVNSPVYSVSRRYATRMSMCV